MRKLSCVLYVVVLVSAILCTGVHSDSRSRCFAPADPGDEAALRVLVDRFFGAYASGNVDKFMGLWSAESPDLARRREQVSQFFAVTDQIQVKNLVVRKLNIQGQNAIIWISLEMSGLNRRTLEAASGLGKMTRSLHCIKKAGGWTVWQETAAEEDFAAEVAAAGPSLREGLLAENADLVTLALVQALLEIALRTVDGEKPREALPAALLAGQVAGRIGDKRAEGSAFRVIGNIYNVDGDYMLALESYMRALELGGEVGDKPGIAKALNNLGYTYYLQGNGDLALDNYNKSLELKQAAGDKAGVAGTLNNMGIVYDQRGNHMQALAYYEKSLALRTELGDRREMATLLNNIGVLHHDQGNSALAAEYYEKSMSLAEALNDKTQTARALNNLGTMKRQRGDLTAALQYYEKSLRIKEAMGNRSGAAVTLTNIGNVYREQGKYAQAMERYQKSSDLHRDLGDKWGLALTIENIATLEEERGNHSKAIEFAERAAEISGEVGYRSNFSDAKMTAGRAYRLLGRLEQARQSLDAAVETEEELRSEVAGGEQEREAFFEDKVSPYQEMVALMVAENDPAAALSYAERSKGRVLLDVLRSGRVKVTKKMTPVEQDRERQLQAGLVSIGRQISLERRRSQPDAARLADLTTQLHKARLDHEAFQAGLYAAHPELKTQRGQAQPISPEQVTNLVSNTNVAFLEYVVTDERTYLLVLSRRKNVAEDRSPKTAGPAADRTAPDVSDGGQGVIRAYELPISGKDLADKSERFRGRLANRDRDYRQFGTELYNLLIKPAASELESKTTLVIVPDGALWTVPFQALQSPNGRFLIEDYALSYSPSLTVLAEMIKARRSLANARREGSPLRLLAIGNPAVAPETAGQVKSILAEASLEPLPEAETQVRALEALYGPGQSLVYVGAGATEEAVKAQAPKYDVLHLATHGVLDDAAPMYSYLVLSQAGTKTTEDGLLEAWEIMNLDLRADLAILSACDTARGRIGAGEGVVGLSWAFFVAGCPTTVVSQWKVDAASTNDLMLEFHRNLKAQSERQPGPAKAEALRQASLKLLLGKRYQHPFYWAAFVLVGNPF